MANLQATVSAHSEDQGSSSLSLSLSAACSLLQEDINLFSGFTSSANVSDPFLGSQEYLTQCYFFTYTVAPQSFSANLCILRNCAL